MYARLPRPTRTKTSPEQLADTWHVSQSSDAVALVVHRRKPRFLAYADLDRVSSPMGVVFRDFQWIDPPPEGVDFLLKRILPEAVRALETLLPPRSNGAVE